MSGDPFSNELLWEPNATARATTRLGRFLTWAQDRGFGEFPTYDAAWNWSTRNPSEFWGAVRDHFSLAIAGEARILDIGTGSPSGLPGAKWFPGAELNAAQIMLDGQGRGDREPALVARSQTRQPEELTWGELRSEVARVRRGLAELGIRAGDRVAAYSPNIPETLVAFLATTSLGAIWTSCAPEFGTRSVLDRLTQTRPKVLFAVDGYRYGTRAIERSDEVDEIVAGLESVEAVVHIGYLDPSHAPPWATASYASLDGTIDPGFLPLPFDHPLWVLYSSGTTGLPKAIVHSHGGITLEHHKALALQSDIGPSDRFFWFTTTGWMMWNYLISGLAVGATLVLFDGDPGYPDLSALWQLAEEARVTAFGVSAPFVDACRRADLHPGRDFDLTLLRWFGSTGAPLSAAGFRWIASEVAPIPISSISGGTDVCTAFVGGSPLVPVRAGVIPCRFLGADVRAFDPAGRSVIGEQGELVVAAPMPSMPTKLWDDDSGEKLRAAYFERFPDVWGHGDWITIAESGECVITGRSDATLNRGGVRLGTADFYAVLADFDEIADSLVVHLDADESDELIAFVVLVGNATLGEELESRVRATLRSQLSPRHVPDVVAAVADVPRTLSGKKTEIPVKRILQGATVAEALATGALANPESIDEYVRWAAARNHGANEVHN